MCEDRISFGSRFLSFLFVFVIDFDFGPFSSLYVPFVKPNATMATAPLIEMKRSEFPPLSLSSALFDRSVANLRRTNDCPSA